MNKLIFSVVIAGLLSSCGDQSAAQNEKQPSQAAEIAPQVAQIDHYYSMKDGFEYGYEAAISQDAAAAGQVAAKLMMFKYAGNKEGKYQVYSKEGATALVAECGNPCDYIKIMTFFQGEHVNTDRLRATEGNIATMVIMDAINGKMEQFIAEKNGKKATVWFDEKLGVKATPIDIK